MENGLWQGCTTAPILFNLYVCVVADGWLERVYDVEGVGTCLFYNYNQQLFRKYTRNASGVMVTKRKFADDVALLASPIAANGRIDVEVYKRIVCAFKAFGVLHVSVFKNTQLSVTTTRRIYQLCVQSMILYGGQCWIPLRCHLKQMSAFHYSCIRTMLVITNR